MTALGGGVVVRQARPGEYPIIGALTIAAYAPVHPAQDDLVYLDELRDVAARAACCTVYVAVDVSTDTVLGSVTYVPGPGTPLSEKERDGEAGFRMLAVAPEAQGRGVGRALVEACIARARGDGRRRLLLLTLPTMTKARGLYGSMGFARAPERDWYVSETIDLKAWSLDL
ncbi:MAG TPA: GNAT family N-acetyltransferase [Candidatus Limnocylindrales bacterium]|nr:GNAT family N-acetyltransferase [Candidatus Limnocylindrales bacterium]